MKNENSTAAGRWMLVDDDDGLRANIAQLLAVIAGVEVESFSSGAAALSAFTAAPDGYEFIVSDLDMPGMSGIDFCKRIKAIRPTIKILLVTGSGIITAEEAAGFGFCGMIRKPFAVAALREALDRAFNNSNLGEMHRTRPSSAEVLLRRTGRSTLLQNDHQPNQAGTVPVCVTA